MRTTLSIIALVVAMPVAAHAHIQLTSPAQRYTDQKSAPCGRAGDTGERANVTTLQSGSTITVTWDETINHPGHFRIAFDADGQDDFYDPPTAETCDTAAPIIADCIADLPGGGAGSLEITLPDIECDNCTLQVIQVMTDKPPFGDGNDMYYQCADLILQRGDVPDAGPTPDAPGPDPGDDGCNSVGAPGPASLLLILAVLALGLGWRRRLTA